MSHETQQIERALPRASSRATNRARANSHTNGPDGAQIAERTLCIVLDIRRPGNRRKVNASQVEVDADRECLCVSKQLLTAPEWLSVVNLDTSLRRYVNANCLPSLFRGGVFLLPLVSVEAVDARLGEFQAERERKVEAFLSVYPDLVIDARTRLRGLYDPGDYPDPAQVRAAFGLTWRYVSLGTPDSLAGISREMFVREREKAAAQWSQAAAAIQTLLRTHMTELVSHMVERLQPDSDGKPKIFKNSLVNNLGEFLRGFEARNIVDDVELAAVVERARGLLDGVEPQLLRESGDVRESLARGFVQVQRQLDTMVTNRPTRRIVLERPPVENVVGRVEATNGSSASQAQNVHQVQRIAA